MYRATLAGTKCSIGHPSATRARISVPLISKNAPETHVSLSSAALTIGPIDPSPVRTKPGLATATTRARPNTCSGFLQRSISTRASVPENQDQLVLLAVIA